MDGPRALVVDLSAYFGGASARALGLLAAMRPGTAALACLRDSPVHRRARDLGLEVHPIAGGKSDVRAPVRLARTIREHRFQVMDAQNPQSKLWAAAAAMLTRTALVSTLNSWYEAEHGGRLKGRVYQRVERATAGCTDMFVAVAPDIRDRLLMSGVGEDRIALIPNAIQIDWAAVPGDRAWLRRLFDVPEDARVLCAVGRLAPAKGYEHLITALEPLAARYPDLHCLIVGDGELRVPLQGRLEALGLSDRVHLAGFRPPDDVLAIIKAADIFVMPSITEGTPVALLEAAALSKPIVASRVGGIPTILTDGVDGLLVTPAAPDELCGAVTTLLNEPARAAALASAARRKVSRDFTREAQVAATLSAYRRAWSRRHALRLRSRRYFTHLP